MTDLVLNEKSALRWMWEMSSGPLNHQFENRVGLDILQVLLPQNGSRLTVNAKQLREKKKKSANTSFKKLDLKSFFFLNHAIKRLISDTTYATLDSM